MRLFDIKARNGVWCPREMGDLQRKRSWFSMIRVLIFGGIAIGIITGFAIWPTVEAQSSQVTLRDNQGMRDWLSERFTLRETMSSFRYVGSTDTLTEQVSKALSEALYSDPFIRYNVSKYSFKWKGGNDYANVTVYVDYRETYAQSLYVRNQAKEIVASITKSDESPHVKVKAIHDYIVSHVAYDEAMTKFTAYEALTEGKTVCQGYALLMQAMFEEAGIRSIIVEGEAGGMLHAWNMIQLDGKWYHIDATWDDPLPDRGDQVRYTYYLRTDAEMRMDHSWTSDNIPQAVEPYEQALLRMHQSDDEALKRLTGQLEQVWSADVLLPDRAIRDVTDLTGRFQSARQSGRDHFQLRYAGSELQLRSDLHDVLDAAGLSAPLEYRVSSLKDNDDLIVEIIMPE
ncbi:transglutaminase [Paenibacillus apiarius]|uniref:transglutaminase domain-containing protein n=1 Tax=Paenibacillus apiarius TaxID=46240 RepID=UPI001594FC6C|nr:transglutaminase domain-containing protein [Paenibacillus apiarius]MCY9515788.1 transglutaminase [Paenibacillus apiarius]MCY9554994.1 transglutaminase [Paenibacillus apiarius]MCY9722948.1 transglutaminase [Paenibacillus apiarius]MCY9730427.1 transglutaminase [Paenibacillus apiarius]MCY9792914.1 transglutaminase [Paenibacillus apiarius]